MKRKNAIYKNKDGYLVMKYGQLEFLVCPDCRRLILDEDNEFKPICANTPLVAEPNEVGCMECAMSSKQYAEYQRKAIEDGGSSYEKMYLLSMFKNKIK